MFSSSLVQRALTLLTLGPFALFILYLGGWFFFVPLAIFLLLATTEYAIMVEAMGFRSPRWLLTGLVGVLLLVAQIFGRTSIPFGLAFFGGLLIGFGNALWRYEQRRERVSADLFVFVTGFVLLGWLGSHLVLLRNIDPTRGSEFWEWSVVTIVATWAADTFAYLVGSYVAGRGIFGRHALTPRLSPNKSVEGYLGGIVLGTLLTTAVSYFLFDLPIPIVVGLALLCTAGGTLGDLVISLLKRESGIKDSGNLFPGHGGALDRADSIIWTVAFAYYFLSLVVQ